MDLASLQPSSRSALSAAVTRNASIIAHGHDSLTTGIMSATANIDCALAMVQGHTLRRLITSATRAVDAASRALSHGVSCSSDDYRMHDDPAAGLVKDRADAGQCGGCEGSRVGAASVRWQRGCLADSQSRAGAGQ